jgi:formate dehydrogenase subunit delta
MEAHVMIHRANSIAQFFSSYPQDEAIAGVVEHLEHFWVPRMRGQLLEYVAEGGSGLHPLVVAAAGRLHPPPPNRS